MFEIRPLTLKTGIYSILLMGILMVLGSCRDGGSDASENQNAPSQTTSTNPASSSDNPGINNIMAGTDNASASSSSAPNASGQYHYICANNCEGSGSDSSGSCPVCGETLLHNDAYHSSGGSETITLPDAGSSANVLQGAGGQHHFMCSAGCGGGSSSQGNCPSCGAALVHNDAYHAQGGSTTPIQQAPSGQSMGDPKVKYPSVFNSPSAPRASVPQGGGGTGHHYICSAGCGGGGPSQGSCPSCGAALVHNDAYHQ